jgi:hypothetical protein
VGAGGITRPLDVKKDSFPNINYYNAVSDRINVDKKMLFYTFFEACGKQILSELPPIKPG